jgi:riboflavin kinase/FMN adenylyltransferase
VDIAVVFNFDQDFSQVTAPEFLREVIVGRFHPSVIVVGYDHHFGYNRKGNADFLRDQASVYGYVVEEIEEVNSSEAAISSSRIRQLLKNGQCEAGARLLGRPYEIPGTVVKGAQRGKRLTFPTANLEPDESYQLIPKHGVYVISASIDDQNYFGVCNVGLRPTFGEQSFAIEAHFFDLPTDDLYHRKIALKFHHWIREEEKFDDANELQAQIGKDIKTAQKWIDENQGGMNLNATID